MHKHDRHSTPCAHTHRPRLPTPPTRNKPQPHARRTHTLPVRVHAGGCDMGGFTRLLHSGEADDLMDEIPTVVVPPLPRDAFGAATDSYVVLNRPYAFVQWWV